MRTAKKVVIGVTACLLTALALGGMLWWKPWNAAAAGADEQSGTSEAVVVPLERGTLATSTKLTGRISYGDPIALPASAGMLTGLPEAGMEIGRGATVYENEGRPVTLMVGARPFWRELSVGSEGEDVRQLQQNLADMGYYDYYVGDKYDWYTEQAVKAWQKDLGVEKTGVFLPSDVVVTSAAPVRIDRVTGKLGESGVSPATYTSPERQISAPLTSGLEKEIEVGQKVEVKLTDGSVLEGAVTDIIPGKPATGEEEEVKAQAIIRAEGIEDASPGEVRIAAIHEGDSDALLVPITALLANADGQYAVEVKRMANGQSTIVRVPVEIGRVSNTKAEILSGDVAEGDNVVVSR